MKESNHKVKESELVAQAQSGDVTSFEALVDLYGQRIYRMARRIVQNDQDAEDVLQETFLKALENLPRFRAESSFYTWIVQIAINGSLQRVKKWHKYPTVSL